MSQRRLDVEVVDLRLGALNRKTQKFEIIDRTSHGCINVAEDESWGAAATSVFGEPAEGYKRFIGPPGGVQNEY